MADLLVKFEKFNGIPVRVVQHNGQVMMPLNDIADGIGLDRSGLRQLLKRNICTLGGYVVKVIITSTSGDKETVCLTRDGVVGILMKTDIGKMKDPIKQDKIVTFQKWSIETLSQIMQGKPISSDMVNNQPDLLKTEMASARFIARETGVSIIALQKIALERCGCGAYIPALTVSGIVHGEAGVWVTPTAIAKLCGVDQTPQNVNFILEDHGLQYRDKNNLWTLTTEGKKYGEHFQFTAPSKHQEPRIRWNKARLMELGIIPKDAPK